MIAGRFTLKGTVVKHVTPECNHTGHFRKYQLSGFIVLIFCTNHNSSLQVKTVLIDGAIA